MKYCCKDFEAYVDIDRFKQYCSEWYVEMDVGDMNLDVLYEPIKYCPFCGKKLEKKK